MDTVDHSQNGSANNGNEPQSLQPLHLTQPHLINQPPQSQLQLPVNTHSIIHRLTVIFPITSRVLNQLPYSTIPFLLCMFIIVESLDSLFWIERLAIGIGYLIHNQVVLAIFISGFGSCILCGILSNQPMTILLTRVLLDSRVGLNVLNQKSSLLSLILSSNNGPNFCITGSLAGLLWRKLLSEKQINITFWEFFKIGFKIMFPVLIVQCSVLTVQSYGTLYT